MPTEVLSLAEARCIALAAQGFAEARPAGRIDRRHLRRVVDRMGVIQIDSVNVLVRSQELPLFARLGPHPRTLIADATAAGELFEYWVHAACHVPVGLHPLLRWKMQREHDWSKYWDLTERRPTYIDEVLRRIELDGPVVAGDLSERTGPKGAWWDWDDAKIALEHLFWKGQVTATRRATDFARVYDLAERVIPRHILDQPDVPEADARRQLLLLAARHHGIGTFKDLIDYHRQSTTSCRHLLREAVADGSLLEVRVDGWDEPAYLHPDARRPRRVDALALLSPFDPVCWYRERASRLFGFDYRIEIYTPEAKRRFGYYVLPVLWGDSLVGRLDLKADRANGALAIQASHTEPGVPAGDLADALAGELWSMAGWLDLPRVVVADRGDLASTLRRSVDRYARDR